MLSKLISEQEFIAKLRNGLTLMVGGFMCVGTPNILIDWVVKSGVKDLTVICNDAGYPNKGVGKLIANRQVKKLIASHIGLNPEAGELMNKGEMEVQLVPQGTLAEQVRAGGTGLGGFLTPTGFGTMVAEGKQVIEVDGRPYLLEKPLKADLALIRASQIDRKGNVFYRGTTRNFNPLMAMAAEQVVAAYVEMVDELDPNIIVTPHCLVDYYVKETSNE